MPFSYVVSLCVSRAVQGMHMGFGGNPYGPAGTGKTESVKALGQAFGRQVSISWMTTCILMVAFVVVVAGPLRPTVNFMAVVLLAVVVGMVVVVVLMVVVVLVMWLLLFWLWLWLWLWWCWYHSCCCYRSRRCYCCSCVLLLLRCRCGRTETAVPSIQQLYPFR